MNLDLFAALPQDERQSLGDGACVLRGFALTEEAEISVALNDITCQAPFRHMITPGGFRMSVAMSNCGVYGWVSDRSGYRYDVIDPESGHPWPHMPDALMKLTQDAARSAGFAQFTPDACLINCYEPGARLSLHQDKNERDFNAPIVSVSLGTPAVFLFGGLQREDKCLRVALEHGDVAVWGGPARLRYHGVLALKENHHSFAGRHRINLTFRQAR